ncbi:MAG: Zn-ribbon domain-containing OB-fold protein [Thermodesulfobacteriota bacterium]|nr:Zn-ribbon domain-containing OB-fold protein [Thermodesulfobacteriota bacterium]
MTGRDWRQLNIEGEYKKNLPIIDGDGREFWMGCKMHKLLIQRCEDCGTYRFPPRILCSNCLSMNTKWSEVKGRGKIFSFMVAHSAFDASGPKPAWNADLPLVTATIDMDEGFRMVGQIVGCKPEEVKIGMEVETFFEDATEDITLPKLKMIS